MIYPTKFQHSTFNSSYIFINIKANQYYPQSKLTRPDSGLGFITICISTFCFVPNKMLLIDLHGVWFQSLSVSQSF